jgi:integrase
MPIRIFVTKTGRVFHDATVQLRSSTYRDLRIQKFKRCDTNAEAVKAVSSLYKEALLELHDRETEGFSWRVLLYKWETEAKRLGRNPATLKPLSDTKRVCILGELRRWTKDWMSRAVRDLSIKDGKDLLLLMTGEDLKPSTIRHIKTYINLVFRFGVQEGLVTEGKKSPIWGVPFDLTDGDTLPEILTMNQAKTLLFEARVRKHPWYAMWATALMTGMRSSELFALRKENIVFDESIIRIKESWDWFNNCPKTTKAKYWRTAPISAGLRPILEECMNRDPDCPFVFPRIREWEQGAQALVLRKFCEEIGVPSIKFHTLRACFATHLLIMGVEQAAIMAIGGWSNFKTFKIYVRLAGVTERHKTEELGKMLLPDPVSIQEHLAKEYLPEMARIA